MDRFNNKYDPLAKITFINNNNIAFASVFPDIVTEQLMKKHRLFIKSNNNVLTVLFKRREYLEPVTIDEEVLVNGSLVLNKKIVDYKSVPTATSSKTFYDFLPTGTDLTLIFLGCLNVTDRNQLNWKNLKLNEYIKYDLTNTDGIKVVNTNLKQTIKPDALIELHFSQSEIANKNEKNFNYTIKNI